MKLSEIKQGEITMIGDGYYIEQDPHQMTKDDSTIVFGLKRLMQDEEVGEASFTREAFRTQDGDIHYGGLWQTLICGKKFSTRVATEAMMRNKKAFGKWIHGHLEQMGLLEAKSNPKLRNRGIPEAPVYLHPINKDGSLSGVANVKDYFSTEKEAVAKHNYLVKINPGRVIKNMLHSTSDFGTFKKELVGHVDL